MLMMTSEQGELCGSKKKSRFCGLESLGANLGVELALSEYLWCKLRCRTYSV